MGELFGFMWCATAGLFRSRAALQAEIVVLRRQLNILRRRSRKDVVLGKSLNSFQEYYNENPPIAQEGRADPRDVQRVGRVLSLPILGGFHHRCVRV
jgi:hypothetical protein